MNGKTRLFASRIILDPIMKILFKDVRENEELFKKYEPCLYSSALPIRSVNDPIGDGNIPMPLCSLKKLEVESTVALDACFVLYREGIITSDLKPNSEAIARCIDYVKETIYKRVGGLKVTEEE